jgi:hypothetical protein
MSGGVLLFEAGAEQGCRMAGFGDDVFARWSHIQGTLFPWLREELDPVTAALEQLIIVLDTIGLAAYVPGPPRHGRGRKPEDRRALARAFVAKACPVEERGRYWACRPRRR